MTSQMMSRVRGKNTKPELALRRELFGRGLRYRLHDGRLPGRPDLVFVSARLAVFVDGDFWHGAGWQDRGLSRFEDQFPTNRDFWVGKIRGNMSRDREVERLLQESGWRVLRILESDIKADVATQAGVVERSIRADLHANGALGH